MGNSGNEDASGVVVSQPVPIYTRFDAGNSSVGWDCPDNSAGGTICHFPIGKLAAGAQESIHFAMVLIDAMPVNVATIEALVTLADDRGATDTDGELTPVDSAPDLALTSSVGVGTAQPRTVLTFFLNYRNIGNQDAIGVILEATVPQFTKFDLDSSAGGWDCADGSTSGATCTFNIGSLAAQAQDSIAFAVSVSGALPTDVQSIEFASVIAASGIEADVANNQATVSAPVVRLTETLFLPIVRRGP